MNRNDRHGFEWQLVSWGWQVVGVNEEGSLLYDQLAIYRWIQPWVTSSRAEPPSPPLAPEACETGSGDEYNPPMEEDQWDAFLSSIDMEPEEWAEIYAPDSGKSDRHEIVPYALAAVTAARWVVYWAQTPTGQRYIGVTVDDGRRMLDHGSRFVPNVGGVLSMPRLTYATAKGVEQALIEAARRQAVPLAIDINSVAPRNKYYQSFKALGESKLKCNPGALPSWLTWP